MEHLPLEQVNYNHAFMSMIKAEEHETFTIEVKGATLLKVFDPPLSRLF
jgi:hypothetical protein